MPAVARSTFRHEALLWRHLDELVDFAVPFVREGLEAEEPVIVALLPPRERLLRGELGSDAEQVLFVDPSRHVGNPGRLVPTWRRLLSVHAPAGEPIRAIGELVWTGRRPEELAESQLNDALLNVAIEPDMPLWQVCAYGTGSLDPAAVEEVHRSHPAVVQAEQYRGSTAYGGRTHVDAVFTAELPALDGSSEAILFDRDQLQHVSSFVAVQAYAAGASANRAADLAVAVKEVVTSSLLRGAMGGTVRIWRRTDAVVCEVRDPTQLRDPMAGRRWSPTEHPRGLLVADQLCDLAQQRSMATGTVVRLYTWL